MHFQRWQKLKAKMVDGIIYVSSNPATSEKLLENITVPVVFMDRKIKKRENMGSVLIDNFSAMKDVAAYIAGKGSQTAGVYYSEISRYRQAKNVMKALWKVWKRMESVTLWNITDME